MKRANGVFSPDLMKIPALAAVLLSVFAYVSPSHAEGAVQASQDGDFLYESVEVNAGSDVPTALEEARQKVRGAFKQMFVQPYHPNRIQTVLEQSVRKEVVDKLPVASLPDVKFEQSQTAVQKAEGTILMEGRISKEGAAQAMALRMAEIESKLSQLRHMGDKGSRLKLLKMLLPNLPMIEEYKRLAADLNRLGITLETDKTPMALLLDRKITILFNEFLVMLDDSIPEAVAYEAEFAAALKQQGLQISSKQPDLVLKYSIETTGEYSKETPLGLSADVDMQDMRQDSYVAYSANVEVGETLTPEIRNNALQLFAKGVFEALKNRLLQTVYEEEKNQSMD